MATPAFERKVSKVGQKSEDSSKMFFCVWTTPWSLRSARNAQAMCTSGCLMEIVWASHYAILVYRARAARAAAVASLPSLHPPAVPSSHSTQEGIQHRHDSHLPHRLIIIVSHRLLLIISLHQLLPPFIKLFNCSSSLSLLLLLLLLPGEPAVVAPEEPGTNFQLTASHPHASHQSHCERDVYTVSRWICPCAHH